VEAVGLHHTYGSGRVGLAGVDLAVAPGERVVLLGPNGSGKTTLLRVLATGLRPDSGSLRLLDRTVPPARPALRRRMGVLPDHPAHLEPLSGAENAHLFASAAGLDRRDAQARVDALFERLALAEAADDPVSAWSLGMRRKLLLVEALAHDPAILLLDEPSMGLDPPAVDVLVELLGERAAAGAATVAAVNDPVVAARIADRVVMLDRGRVVADASPGALLEELGGGIRCEVEVAGPPADAVRVAGAVVGVDVHHSANVLEARLVGGSAGLPRLVSALVEEGVEIRSFRVREPDLRDVFRARTGRPLGGAERP
jgi:ABC-2 type transport system ATP-binding protein